MPARIVVSREEIAEAAASLIAAGDMVTGWTLRRALGGRGRADRLDAVWRDLQAEGAPPPPPEPEAPPLPPALVEHLSSAEERALAEIRAQLAAAWRLASDLASRRVADEVRVARDQVTALETDLAEAVRAVEEADAQVETLRDDLAASRQAATCAEVALAAVRAETERGAAAATARHEAMSQEAERLRAELAVAREGIDAARRESAAAEASAMATTQAVHDARAERDGARQEAAQARAELRQVEAISAREGARAEAAEQRAAEAQQRTLQAEKARMMVAEQLTQQFGRAQVAEASAAIWRDQANADKGASMVEAPAAETAPLGNPTLVMAPATAPASPRRRENAARGGTLPHQKAGASVIPLEKPPVPGGAS